MPFLKYLPSAQFGLMAGSLVLAGGLIVAAGAITNPSASTNTIASVDTGASNTADWQKALEEVQAQAPGLPEMPDPSLVEQLREGINSSNLTESLGKTLLLDLTNAAAQGLGSDIPTQEKLVAQAAAQTALKTDARVYTAADIKIVAQNKASLHAYGNAAMGALFAHQTASVQDTLYKVGYALDYHDQKSLDALAPIAADYEALTEELAAVAVPQTLAPLHVQLLNDFSEMTAAFPDMQRSLQDPIRGLRGLQTFQSKGGEAVRVLTSLSQILVKNAILFNKDEAGSNWSVFVSP